MAKFGIEYIWDNSTIFIHNQPYKPVDYTVESDWSGASYWYGFIALNPEGGKLLLPGLREESTQGDQAIVQIMDQMGVLTQFKEEGVLISNHGNISGRVEINFKECPDLAQTVMVVAAAKGIQLEMTGLESLKIKETNRVQAMMNELKKLGAELREDGNRWYLTPSKDLPSSISVETYEDHRMAMAFAPLATIMDVEITEPEVVNKSYPQFWEEVGKFVILTD